MIDVDLQLHCIVRQIQTPIDIVEDSLWQRGGYCIHQNVHPQETLETFNNSILGPEWDSRITVCLPSVINSMSLVYNHSYQMAPKRRSSVPHDIPGAHNYRHCYLGTCLHHPVPTIANSWKQVAGCGQRFGVYVYGCDHHVVEVRHLLLYEFIERHNYQDHHFQIFKYHTLKPVTLSPTGEHHQYYISFVLEEITQHR